MEEEKLKMKINKIIKFLIISESVTMLGLGFVTPIFAIFIIDKITGGNIKVAGFAGTVYMIAFALTRLPTAYGVDRKMKENQRLYLLTGGTILFGISYFLYLLVRFPWQVYLLQILSGIGSGSRYSAFTNLYTRYIDKGLESFEWGINAVVTSLALAATAAIGGILANKFGFDIIFVLVGIFVLLSSTVPIVICKNLIKFL